LTFFIYFSLIAEAFIFFGALILFLLPGNIAKVASVFFFISELPFVATSQIIIIVSDSGAFTYATFGIPALFLTPLLWFFAVWIFISIQSFFDAVDRDSLGRAPAGSARRFRKR
jgi:hypothetical protein